jgi:hypothetical protein
MVDATSHPGPQIETLLVRRDSVGACCELVERVPVLLQQLERLPRLLA